MNCRLRLCARYFYTLFDITTALGIGISNFCAYGTKLDTAYATGTTNKKGSLTLIDDSKSYAASESAYAAFIYTYGTEDDRQFLGNIGYS